MTHPTPTLPTVERTARLTERLQQSAQAHQDAIALSSESEREILQSLNHTIQDMIADTPLMLPEPMTASAANDTGATGVPAQPVEQDELKGWLTRPDDAQPEPRSRGSVITICAGVMLLSILAGYGSAQLVNRSFETTDADGSDWKDIASQAAVTLSWPSRTPKTSATTEQADADPMDRITVTPALSLATRSDDAAAMSEDDLYEQTPAEAEARAFEAESEEAFGTDEAVDEGTASTLATGGVSLAALANGVPEPSPAAAPENTAAIPTIPGTASVTEKPTTSPTPTVSSEQRERLFRRAEQLIANGDIAAARLMLRHIAEAGSGPAALMLARAFDPDWLAQNGASSIPGNRDLALRWYTMARDRGESAAAERVSQLERVQ